METSFQPDDLINNRYRVEAIRDGYGLATWYDVIDEHIPGLVKRSVKVRPNYSYWVDLSGHDRMPVEYDAEPAVMEARILGMLCHSSIPAIHDFFLLEDQARCTVMDLLSGSYLETIANKITDPLSPDLVVMWMLKLCDIVGYLHSLTPPIVFRDVTPANILCDDVGTITLMNFGCAMPYRPHEQAENWGTIGFAAIEVYECEPEPRSDIFSIGATMHALLTKADPRMRAPFTFHQYPISAYNPRSTPELEAVVMRCVQLDPSRRYQTISELREALSQLPGRI